MTAEGPVAPVVLGETIQLNCTASGLADPNVTSYEWVQVDVDAVLTTDPSNGILDVVVAAVTQYGEYRCTVYGSNGTNTSETVEVVQACKFIQEPDCCWAISHTTISPPYTPFSPSPAPPPSPLLFLLLLLLFHFSPCSSTFQP